MVAKEMDRLAAERERLATEAETLKAEHDKEVKRLKMHEAALRDMKGQADLDRSKLDAERQRLARDQARARVEADRLEANRMLHLQELTMAQDRVFERMQAAITLQKRLVEEKEAIQAERERLEHRHQRVSSEIRRLEDEAEARRVLQEERRKVLAGLAEPGSLAYEKAIETERELLKVVVAELERPRDRRIEKRGGKKQRKGKDGEGKRKRRASTASVQSKGANDLDTEGGIGDGDGDGDGVREERKRDGDNAVEEGAFGKAWNEDQSIGKQDNTNDGDDDIDDGEDDVEEGEGDEDEEDDAFETEGLMSSINLKLLGLEDGDVNQRLQPLLDHLARLPPGDQRVSELVDAASRAASARHASALGGDSSVKIPEEIAIKAALSAQQALKEAREEGPLIALAETTSEVWGPEIAMVRPNAFPHLLIS